MGNKVVKEIRMTKDDPRYHDYIRDWYKKLPELDRKAYIAEAFNAGVKVNNADAMADYIINRDKYQKANLERILKTYKQPVGSKKVQDKDGTTRYITKNTDTGKDVEVSRNITVNGLPISIKYSPEAALALSKATGKLITEDNYFNEALAALNYQGKKTDKFVKGMQTFANTTAQVAGGMALAPGIVGSPLKSAINGYTEKLAAKPVATVVKTLGSIGGGIGGSKLGETAADVIGLDENSAARTALTTGGGILGASVGGGAALLNPKNWTQTGNALMRYLGKNAPSFAGASIGGATVGGVGHFVGNKIDEANGTQAGAPIGSIAGSIAGSIWGYQFPKRLARGLYHYMPPVGYDGHREQLKQAFAYAANPFAKLLGTKASNVGRDIEYSTWLGLGVPKGFDQKYVTLSEQELALNGKRFGLENWINALKHKGSIFVLAKPSYTTSAQGNKDTQELWDYINLPGVKASLEKEGVTPLQALTARRVVDPRWLDKLHHVKPLTKAQANAVATDPAYRFGTTYSTEVDLIPSFVASGKTMGDVLATGVKPTADNAMHVFGNMAVAAPKDIAHEIKLADKMRYSIGTIDNKLTSRKRDLANVIQSTFKPMSGESVDQFRTRGDAYLKAVQQFNKKYQDFAVGATDASHVSKALAEVTKLNPNIAPQASALTKQVNSFERTLAKTRSKNSGMSPLGRRMRLLGLQGMTDPEAKNKVVLPLMLHDAFDINPLDKWLPKDKSKLGAWLNNLSWYRNIDFGEALNGSLPITLMQPTYVEVLKRAPKL